MSTAKSSLEEQFLTSLGISVAELAALRGVSRQHASSDQKEFLKNTDGLNALCRTLLVIGTERSRDVAAQLRRFAVEHLGISLVVGSAVSVAGSKTYSQLFKEQRELWIWSASPLDVELPGYWERLCLDFLDEEDRLLAYFVPSLEVADRLALRFENELFNRQYDENGKERQGQKGFGATVFIIVTNLVATMPYVVLANPGSANLKVGEVPPSAWALGKQGQDMFEISGRFNDQLIQKVRAAGLGVARQADNFFPMGQRLQKDSGIPFWNYRNLDHLVGIRLEHPIGLFDGQPIGGALPADDASTDNTFTDSEFVQHPLKFYPAFIRGYRRKVGEWSKKNPPRPNPTQYFKF